MARLNMLGELIAAVPAPSTGYVRLVFDTTAGGHPVPTFLFSDGATLAIPATFVSSVGATSPIASSGGTTPTISIQASSGSQAGSMSASQASQLAALVAGEPYVETVGATAPLTSTGGINPTIAINAAGPFRAKPRGRGAPSGRSTTSR
jgi:hypothetical protein